MQPTLEQVLKELPAYLGHFTQMLTQPSQLVSDHLQAEDSKARLEQSIAFLLVSFAIAAVLAMVFPEVTNPVKLVGDGTGMAAHAFAAIRLLFELLGLAGLAYLAAKIVGVSSGFQRFFGLMCAACGVMLVIQVFAGALTNISMADPVTAQGWIQLEKGMAEIKPLIQQGVLCHSNANTGTGSAAESGKVKPDAKLGAELQTRLAALQTVYLQATDRPLFKFAGVLQLIALVILLVWSGRIWGMYLNSHALTTARVATATLLLVVFTGAGTLVFMMVNAGADMMTLYRQCH